MLFTWTLFFFCQVASKHRSTAVWRMCPRDLQVMIDTLAMWHTSNCFRLAYCRRKLKTAPALKLLTCWSSANSQRLASPQSQEKDLMVGLANLHAPRSSETIQRDLHRKLETHCDYWSCCDCCDFAVFESCVDFPDYSNCRLALGYHYLKERRGSESKKNRSSLHKSPNSACFFDGDPACLDCPGTKQFIFHSFFYKMRIYHMILDTSLSKQG